MNTPEIVSRKQFAEDIKILQQDEYHEIFRILKRSEVEYSENTNGIFFDLNQVSEEIFQKLCEYLQLCLIQRQNEKKRTHEMELIGVNQFKEESH